MSFDVEEFLSWLDEQPGGAVDDDLVREEWPGFYDEYELIGITVTPGENGETFVPKRDYRHAVIYGHPLD